MEGSGRQIHEEAGGKIINGKQLAVSGKTASPTAHRLLLTAY